MIYDHQVPYNLSKFSFRTYPTHKDNLFCPSRTVQYKTLDHYFIKPKNQKTKPLALNYISNACPTLSETILKFDIPRCIISSKVQDWTSCAVCKKNEKSVVLYPCSHLCICHACSSNSLLKECPICNSTIAHKSKVKS